MKMRSVVLSLGAMLCMALSGVAYAVTGPVPAAVAVMLAQVAPEKPATLAAAPAAVLAIQALPAADNATASASERHRSGTLPGQATASYLTPTPTTSTAEVGLPGKVLAGSGKGCGKPPRKLTS